jgi:hypothetical protein
VRLVAPGRLLACLLVVLGTVAATGARGQQVVRGPFLQNPLALPTTASVLWWTDVPGDAVVEYGSTPSAEFRAVQSQQPACEIGAHGTCHRVDLAGLAAGARYYYRLLTNGVVVQDWGPTFRTLLGPTDPADLVFDAISDYGFQEGNPHSQIADLIEADTPDVLMTSGDNNNLQGTLHQWDAIVLAPYRDVMRRVFFFPAVGNHDLQQRRGFVHSTYADLFALPRNGDAPEQDYSFDDGDAHFTVLKSVHCCPAARTAWLKNDLASTSRKWKLVFFHHAPRSCASGRHSSTGSARVLRRWGPIFEQYDVDLVIAGHSHIYERSRFIDDYLADGSRGQDGHGTRYVENGWGGATDLKLPRLDRHGRPVDRARRQCDWLADDCPGGVGGRWCSFAAHGYVTVRVVGDATLTLRAVRTDGSVADTVTISKP